MCDLTVLDSTSESDTPEASMDWTVPSWVGTDLVFASSCFCVVGSGAPGRLTFRKEGGAKLPMGVSSQVTVPAPDKLCDTRVCFSTHINSITWKIWNATHLSSSHYSFCGWCLFFLFNLLDHKLSVDIKSLNCSSFFLNLTSSKQAKDGYVVCVISSWWAWGFSYSLQVCMPYLDFSVL